jgi:hypothetical protein
MIRRILPILCAITFTAFGANANAGTVWIDSLKVKQVHVDVSGNLYVLFDRDLPNLCGAAGNRVVAVPKTVPGSSIVFTDSVLNRITASAQTAFVSDAVVSVGVETTYACMWGVYPIVVQFGIFK